MAVVIASAVLSFFFRSPVASGLLMGLAIVVATAVVIHGVATTVSPSAKFRVFPSKKRRRSR